MSPEKRRLRLMQVLDALIQLDEFSGLEAKQQCQEAHPGYVTRTLEQLVQSGVLEKQGERQRPRFRWAITKSAFQPAVWIDQQIHGDQVREMPTEERPREKLLRSGAAALSTAELLAILIRVGVRGESAVTGGRKLANRFNERLEQMRDQTQLEMRDISRAVTAANYCQIMAGVELGRRVAAAEIKANQQPEQIKITSTSTAVAYCSDQFRYLANDATQEEFHIVTLDTKHKPIRTHRITVGTLDASLVHPREVFRPAIRDAASAVLLVHNHPSGDPTPSREDHQVTERLTDAGVLIGITVLDHIIVASEHSLSIREVS